MDKKTNSKREKINFTNKENKLDSSRSIILVGFMISLAIIIVGSIPELPGDGVPRNESGESVLLEGKYYGTQNYVHKLNEEGKIFSIENYHSDVGNGENRTFIIKTNSKEVHLLEYAFTGSDSPQDLFLYEGVNVSNMGNAIDIQTRNRKSNKTSTSLAYTDPTITDYGIQLDRDLLTSTKKQGGQIRRVPYDWILKSNTTYALVTINRGGVEEQILNVIWYEKEK